jgi:hypothetical protein
MKVPFNPDVHTFDALQQQLAELHAQQAILVGSIGHTAFIPDLFERRGEHPLKTNKNHARDIDVVCEGYTLAGPTGPFPVDLQSTRGDDIDLKHCQGSWILRRPESGYVAQLADEIMEPQMLRTVGGIACRTFSLPVHISLITSIGSKMRPKDKQRLSWLHERLTSKDYRLLASPAFEPFRTVALQNDRRIIKPIRRIVMHHLEHGRSVAGYGRPLSSK